MIEGLKRSWKSGTLVALLIVAPPTVVIGMDLADDLQFLLKSTSAVGEVYETQINKTRIITSTSFQGPDIEYDAWIPTISIAIHNKARAQGIRCNAVGALNVFGDGIYNELDVRRRLAELEVKRVVDVRFRVEGGETDCRLHVAHGTRWILYAIFFVLTVAFLVSTVLDMRSNVSNASP